MMRNPFRCKPRPVEMAPGSERRDLGPDPLDPHGDGTIRPGDPLWQVFESGQPIIAERRDDGEWDVAT